MKLLDWTFNKSFYFYLDGYIVINSMASIFNTFINYKLDLVGLDIKYVKVKLSLCLIN
jgi:hypothetical protein